MPSSCSSSSSSEDTTQRAARRFLRAARKGKLRTLKRRYRKHPNLDIESRVPSSRGSPESGRTAMHLACAAGAEDIIRWLIKRGADVTVADDSGCTPAHLIAKWAPARPTALDVLRRAGADLHRRWRVGGNETPLEIAAKAMERSETSRRTNEERRRKRRELA
jgi:NF-kappa-B inhibitor-like protein 1